MAIEDNPLRATVHIDYLARHDSFVTQLAQWHFGEWPDIWPGESVETRADRLRSCGAGGIPSMFIAFEGAVLFGSAGLVQSDLSDRPDLQPWLAAVYVTSSMRRRGIGTQLIAAVEREARRCNVSRLYLYTATAEKYYARRGWFVLEHMNRRGQQQAVMALDLLPA